MPRGHSWTPKVPPKPRPTTGDGRTVRLGQTSGRKTAMANGARKAGKKGKTPGVYGD